jgi:hypothetical protein
MNITLLGKSVFVDIIKVFYKVILNSLGAQIHWQVEKRKGCNYGGRDWSDSATSTRTYLLIIPIQHCAGSLIHCNKIRKDIQLGKEKK